MMISLWVLATSLLVSGCELTSENRTTQTPLRVQETTYQAIVPSTSLNRNALVREVDKYERSGNGGIEIRVMYDPAAPKHNKGWARAQSDKLRKTFEKTGIPKGWVNADILPVKDLAVSQTIIRYQALEVKTPEECEGSNNQLNTKDIAPDYVIGCTHEDIFAKQIYRNRDLLSTGSPSGETLGDRVSQSVDLYRTGIELDDFQVNSTTEGE